MELLIVSLFFTIVTVAQSVLFYKLFTLKVKAEKSNSVSELMMALEKPKREEPKNEHLIPLEQIRPEDL